MKTTFSAKINRSVNDTIREHSGTGGVFRRISVSDPDPKIAALAVAYEAQLEKPLCKRFLIHKPKLVMLDYEQLLQQDGTYLQGLFPPGKHTKYMTQVITPNYIIVAKPMIDRLPTEQLAALVGHELGHILQLDTSSRKSFLCRLQTKFTPSSEIMSDRLGVYLSSGQATREALNAMDRLMEAEPCEPEKIRDGLIRRFISPRSYPRADLRLTLIDQASERLSGQEGVEAFEAEMGTALAGIHKQAYPRRNGNRHYGENIAKNGDLARF